MKEEITWSGQKYEMEWFSSDKIGDIQNITQVYGFLFDEKGNICIVRPSKARGWRLPGGGPEKKDKNWKDTIIREAKEEADIELDYGSLKLFGYIKVVPISENCEKREHYLLRVVGNIKKIGEQTIDIAENLINERKFISPNNFLKYCQWGENGRIQVNEAVLNYDKRTKKNKKFRI